MNRNDLCLLIIVLIYVIFMFYSIINDHKNDKDIIEGFGVWDNVKGIITLPIKIIKFFLTILKLPCKLVDMVEGLLGKIPGV